MKTLPSAEWARIKARRATCAERASHDEVTGLARALQTQYPVEFQTWGAAIRAAEDAIKNRDS